MNIKANTPSDLVKNEFEAAQEAIANIKSGVKGAIIGQERLIDLCLCAILSQSHALLVGMPGLAKTKLVEALAVSCGLDWGRVQFTPDLMPSDILGSEILQIDENGKRHFEFQSGPIFSQLLMADEINRASPKTQSALLQAMQENIVTISGKTYELPKPFHVLATQNPIDHEGAYPLPEAQLDRFLLQIDVPYPTADEEKQIILATTGNTKLEAKKAIDVSQLVKLQNLVREIPISERVFEVAIGIVRQLRPQTTNIKAVKNHIIWGPGPRGAQALILAAKARALLNQRLSPSLDDLVFIAKPALAHRMSIDWSAEKQGFDADNLINEAFNSLGA